MQTGKLIDIYLCFCCWCLSFYYPSQVSGRQKTTQHWQHCHLNLISPGLDLIMTPITQFQVLEWHQGMCASPPSAGYIWGVDVKMTNIWSEESSGNKYLMCVQIFSINIKMWHNLEINHCLATIQIKFAFNFFKWLANLFNYPQWYWTISLNHSLLLVLSRLFKMNTLKKLFFPNQREDPTLLTLHY